jgi:dihydroxyacid dehydratase/phosphogluconate dehydratase
MQVPATALALGEMRHRPGPPSVITRDAWTRWKGDALRLARGLRSREWFGKRDRDGMIHRSGLLMKGFPRDVANERPAIGITNSWSELTRCNAHLRALGEAAKRGVWEAGGLQLEWPRRAP